MHANCSITNEYVCTTGLGRFLHCRVKGVMYLTIACCVLYPRNDSFTTVTFLRFRHLHLLSTSMAIESVIIGILALQVAAR